MAAIILCDDTGKGAPFFPALAKSFQDKHRAYIASSKEACPVSGDAPWPQLVVFSPAHTQWSLQTEVAPAAAVAGKDIVESEDKTALTRWFDTHRFPGIWTVSYENFHQLIHAGRRTALVAVDETKKVEMRKIEKIIRDYQAPVASKTKGHADVWPYADNCTYWGVVDGTLAGLDGFGISSKELPRVVVFEAESWIEDSDMLSIWDLKGSFKNLPNMLRYGSGVWGFVMKHFYKPWHNLDKSANAAAGSNGRLGLAAFLIVGCLMTVHKLGTGMIWIFNSMVAGDKPKGDNSKKKN